MSSLPFTSQPPLPPQIDFVAAMREKQNCEDAASACQKRLRLAQRLTRSLSAERERWTASLDKLRQVGGGSGVVWLDQLSEELIVSFYV
jgi:hypothetical protein